MYDAFQPTSCEDHGSVTKFSYEGKSVAVLGSPLLDVFALPLFEDPTFANPLSTKRNLLSQAMFANTSLESRERKEREAKEDEALQKGHPYLSDVEELASADSEWHRVYRRLRDEENTIPVLLRTYSFRQHGVPIERMGEESREEDEDASSLLVFFYVFLALLHPCFIHS